MKKKAYLIVHDGTQLLVGQGGRSGFNKVERQGYHFPGGSVKSNPKATVIRELEEETGFIIDEASIDDTTFQVVDGDYFITFYLLKVDSVDLLIDHFNRNPPPIANQYDEPFTDLLSIQSKDSWNNENFDAKYQTDWFKKGLLLAKDIIDLK